MEIGYLIGYVGVAMFFVMGYVTYYSTSMMAFKGSIDRPSFSPAYRWWRYFLVLIFLVVLQCVANISLMNRPLFLNFQLFVAWYTLFDDNQGRFEHGVRWLIIMVIWIVNHELVFSNIVTIASVMLLAIVGVLMNLRQTKMGEWVNVLITIVVGASYWLTDPMTSLQVSIVSAIIFMLMGLYAFRFGSQVKLVKREKTVLTAKLNRDPLTGIGNYTRFRTDGEAAFQRAQKNGTELMFAVADIDHFKAINDKYGHPAGDQCLIDVTQVLTEILTKANPDYKLYRTGGEELTMLLPDCNAKEGVAVLMACCDAVRNYDFVYQEQVIRTSISIGASAVTVDDRFVEQRLKKADDNLYLSKQRGRDAVTVDGKTTRSRNSFRTPLLTYTFYTQPIMDRDRQIIISSELFFKAYENGMWRTPDYFHITNSTLIEIVKRMGQSVEGHALCLNIEHAGILDQAVIQQLVALKQTPGSIKRLYIEVGTPDDWDELAAVSDQYRAAGVKMVLKNATTILQHHQPEELAHFDGFKIPLQDIIETYGLIEAEQILQQCVDIARQADKFLVLMGVNTRADMALVERYHIRYIQGDYVSRPILPRIV